MRSISREIDLLYSVQYKLLMYKSLNRKMKENYTFEEICNEHNLSKDELKYIIDKINLTNDTTIPITETRKKININHNKKTYNIHKFTIPKKSYKICFMADKHIGHICDHKEYVHRAYEEGDKRGVDLYLDLGDILNGPQEATTFKHKDKIRLGNLEDALLEAEKFHISDKPTYFITGNHDMEYMRYNQCDIGRVLEDQVKNLYFLDNLFAPLEINGLRINLSHGYLEQMILNMVNFEKDYQFLTVNDPHVVLQAHFHNYNIFEKDDRILCQLPSLRFGDKHTLDSVNRNIDSKYTVGAIILTVHEFDDKLEIRLDEIRFTEKKENIKVLEYVRKR